MSAPKLSEFVQGYLTCALWSSTDDNGESLDSVYGLDDIAASSITSAVEECVDFQAAYAADLAQAGDDSQNGHDFWLTRNRHGAGFWDRGYGDAGKRLTEAAHTYGEMNPFVGDDGNIYIE